MTNPDEAAAAAVERYVAGMSETEFAALIARTRMPTDFTTRHKVMREIGAQKAEQLLRHNAERDRHNAIRVGIIPEADEATETAGDESGPPSTGMQPNPAQGGSSWGSSIPHQPSTREKAEQLLALRRNVDTRRTL